MIFVDIPLHSVWQPNSYSSLGPKARIRRCEVVGFERRVGATGDRVVLRNLDPPHRVSRVKQRFFGLPTYEGWLRVPGVKVVDGIMVPE